MVFEYDQKKSITNKEKHGIDFHEARELWLDQNRLVIPARSDDEDRFALLAKYRGKVWAAFFTVREESIRIISVRRARDAEENIYEG